MSEVIIKDEGGIRIIILNRPKALNALHAGLIREVGEKCEEVRGNNSFKGIIITGQGEKAFAAGADIKGFSTLTKEDALHLSKEGHDIFNRIENFPKPIIAAVNGYALGGGLELAMACHMRIGSENSVFGLPEVKLGLIPGYGGTQRLAYLIGKAKAMEYVLTASMMSSAEALSYGLINHRVEQGQEVSKAAEIINVIAQRGPLAIAAAIKNVNLSSDANADGFASEIESFAELMMSDQCKEGVSAFIEKRKPSFD